MISIRLIQYFLFDKNNKLCIDMYDKSFVLIIEKLCYGH